MFPRSFILSLIVVAASGVETPDAQRSASEQRARPWTLIEGKHWQVVSAAAPEPAAVTDFAEGTEGRCSEGMVEVEGRMRVVGSGPADGVEKLQDETCIDWIDREFPERCARFDEPGWRALSRNLPTEPMHFCIDRFEYPNERRANPWIMVDWNDACSLCERGGKRLCSEAEWTFACEGDEALPYPYGYVRDSEACVIDRAWRPVDEAALASSDSERVRRELDRLWQGEASGARPHCRSPFGVYDMTGNVDEWTVSVLLGERPSILKGGYWGPVRTRCRPSTRAHGEDFAFYQQGFRCCSDVPVSSEASRTP